MSNQFPLEEHLIQRLIARTLEPELCVDCAVNAAKSSSDLCPMCARIEEDRLNRLRAIRDLRAELAAATKDFFEAPIGRRQWEAEKALKAVIAKIKAA